MSRQFSSHQEHYPSRSGGTLGADRKAATALVFQGVVAGVASTVAIQGDDGAIIAIQASALNTDDVIFNAALTYVNALGGGLTYFEVGNYNTSDPIAFPGNNLALVGTGRGSFINGDLLATNEHAIEITGRTDCTLRNFSVQTNDGGTLNIHCIFIEDGADRFLVDNITIVDSDTDGIHVEGTAITGGVIKYCTILDVDNSGIYMDPDGGNLLSSIHIIGNLISSAGGWGITFGGTNYIEYSVISGNIVTSATISGISLLVSRYCSISSNVCYENILHGIHIRVATNLSVINNVSFNNVQHGIFMQNADNNIVSDNISNGNDSGGTASYDGINIDADSTSNIVNGNSCIENDRDGIQVNGDNNQIVENICNTNGDYGIRTGATANLNLIKNNTLENNTLGIFLDGGTNTRLATIPIQLIQGTTFISAAGIAWGWEIDLDTEFALGIGWLPLELQQIVRIRIIAVGLAAPGAGNEMRAQFTGEAATFDEVFTTHAIDVVDLDSEETNFAINDVIHWILDATNDADIANILGGDRLQLKVLHEGAGGGSIQTDAVFSSIEIEYV